MLTLNPRKFVLILTAAVGLATVLSAAEETIGRWGLGGAIGIGDFLRSSDLREATKPGPYAAGWLRYGMTERGELLLALDSVQGKGTGDNSQARLRPVTVNWLQSFGDGAWTPFVTAGAGPVWTRGTGTQEKDRMMFSFRAGTGLEHPVGESLSVGAGLTYNHAFADGRYAPASSALSANVSANWFFRCGNIRPVPKAAPKAAAPPPEADADGDGVPDSRDSCPGTESGVPVDALGCPKDTDLDGVLDSKDNCPDTPAGTLVDETGCVAKEVSVTLDIKFALGKAEVNPDFDPQLQRVADFMKRFPQTTVLIEGHSDNLGNPQGNRALSQKRAEAVRNHLVWKFGVDGSRVTAKGFGPDRPIADNKTEQGRAANRRVVAVVSDAKK
jgi:OOP family OmpA-OmpF porin